MPGSRSAQMRPRPLPTRRRLPSSTNSSAASSEARTSRWTRSSAASEGEIDTAVLLLAGDSEGLLPPQAHDLGQVRPSREIQFPGGRVRDLLGDDLELDAIADLDLLALGVRGEADRYL